MEKYYSKLPDYLLYICDILSHLGCSRVDPAASCLLQMVGAKICASSSI